MLKTGEGGKGAERDRGGRRTGVVRAGGVGSRRVEEQWIESCIEM